MLETLLAIAGVLLLLLLAVLVVGLFLPSVYECEVRHASARTAADIWPHLLDPAALPFGGKQCRGVTVESAPGEPLRWKEELGPSKLSVRELERTEGERLLVEGADSVVPMTLRREFRLEPRADGTDVRVSNRIEVRSGTWHVPVFRVVMSLGAASAGVKDHLRRLAARLGERATLG